MTNVGASPQDRSAVQGQEHDNCCQVYQRKIDALYAVANIASSQQKSAPPDNLPQPVLPIFYDLYQKKRVYAGRCIPESDVSDVAKNYC